MTVYFGTSGGLRRQFGAFWWCLVGIVPPPPAPFRSRDAPAGVARDLSERGFVFARVVVAARQKKETSPLGVVFFFWRAATTTRAKTNALSSCSLGGFWVLPQITGIVRVEKMRNCQNLGVS